MRRVALLALAAMSAARADPTRGALSASDSPAARAAALLAAMHLEEKITLLHGVPSLSYTGATGAVPRLGIPALALNDGRQGFRTNDGSTGQTAFPCQLAVAASWDRAAWRAFGEAMGREFVGKGANVLLAPMLILARVINGGRNFEAIGEDPELAYHFAFAHVSGAQSVPGCLSNADDYIGNNQETNRGDVSAVIDERTLHELYYRGYKGAIDANVASIMCSYNRINGSHACENSVTLSDLKRPDGLNFSGFVLSDWGGVHSTVASALAGLDQEMPGDEYFGAALRAAVEAGTVPAAVVDDKVLRVLTPMFAAGLFDLPPPSGTADTNVTSGAHAALARALAASGTVLLSNAGGALPLVDGRVAAITVMGDAAHVDPYCCGRGSGGLEPPYVVDPLAGISERAGPGCTVTYLPSPPFFSNISTWYSALRGDSFLDFDCAECFDLYAQVRVEGGASAQPCAGCVELSLFYNSATSSNLVAAAGFSPPEGWAYVRPEAWVLPLNYSGSAPTLLLELWRGATTPSGQPLGSHTDYWTLASDASRAEAVARGYTKLAELGRLVAPGPGGQPLPPPPLPPSDVLIIVVSTDSGEGSDRPSLALSDADNAMIAAAAAARPRGRLVVVLNAPAAVLMPWAADVDAILMQFYPGQEMGHALADILWGDINPSGRLPVTFPARAGDSPLQTPEQYPGVNGTVTYSERLLIGYRWFDESGTAPAFAFGHGLSYTNFTYSALTVDTVSAAPSVLVGFTVANTGGVGGREVAQLYLGFPPAAGEPPLQLRDFAVVGPLSPGEARNVSFLLDARATSVWDVGAYRWAIPPGEFQLAVGASSRDIRLRGTLTPSSGHPERA